MLSSRMSTGMTLAPRTVARSVLAAVFLAAGVLHLTSPAPFVSIIPAWVPWAGPVVALTGLLEIAGAFGLCIPRLRRAAGLGLALYAVCVFPANIQHALDSRPGDLPGWWYHAPRLAFQPVIVWWALWASGLIDWPFRRRGRETDSV
jgi:uncharacterized membrane protein